MPYELLKDTKKKQLGKNEEAKITIYNALPRKKYDRVFMCKTAKEIWHTLIITHQGNSQVKNCKIDLLTQEYEKFLISSDETIDSGSQDSMIFVTTKTTKDKVKSLALKAKVTRDQTSDSQDGSDEDIYEEEAEAFNLLARNFWAWSDSNDGDEHKNDATCLMAIDSKESNLKGKVVGRGNISHDFITITNVEHVSDLAFNLIKIGQLCDDNSVVNFTKVDCDFIKKGKLLAKEHRRNDLYTCKLGDNFKQQICLASVVDNSTLWHRRLGHANMRLVQNIASNELLRNLPKLSFKRHFCDTCGLGHQGFILNTKVHLTKFDPKSYEGMFLRYSQTSKAYIVLNKETMRIEESLNVTFDESLPDPKSSTSVEDDRIDEPIVQDLYGSPLLQVNVLDEGYPKSLKEARVRLIEQVIGEFNERKLRSKTNQA
nr:retrotransposon protein [Tanacetum cinerariifolium]